MVTLTLVPTNLYLIEPGFEAATINIGDSSTTVGIQFAAGAAPDGADSRPAESAVESAEPVNAEIESGAKQVSDFINLEVGHNHERHESGFWRRGSVCRRSRTRTPECGASGLGAEPSTARCARTGRSAIAETVGQSTSEWDQVFLRGRHS